MIKDISRRIKENLGKSRKIHDQENQVRRISPEDIRSAFAFAPVAFRLGDQQDQPQLQGLLGGGLRGCRHHHLGVLTLLRKFDEEDLHR